MPELFPALSPSSMLPVLKCSDNVCTFFCYSIIYILTQKPTTKHRVIEREGEITYYSQNKCTMFALTDNETVIRRRRSRSG